MYALQWIFFAFNDLVNPSKPHRVRAEAFPLTHKLTHTHNRCNNIRVGDDFKGWLNFGFVWVQLGFFFSFSTLSLLNAGNHNSYNGCWYLPSAVFLNRFGTLGLLMLHYASLWTHQLFACVSNGVHEAAKWASGVPCFTHLASVLQKVGTLTRGCFLIREHNISNKSCTQSKMSCHYDQRPCSRITLNALGLLMSF